MNYLHHILYNACDHRPKFVVKKSGNIFSRINQFISRVQNFKRREEKHLDATEWFIALIICSTCFGHLYAHHQKLETIFVLLPHMVGNALVAGGRRSGPPKLPRIQGPSRARP